MGLNFSYLLYFKREHLWDALQGLVQIAERHSPSTIIHFPDHDLEIPLEATYLTIKEYRFDEPSFGFATCLKFEEDDAILEFTHYRDDEEGQRSPPDLNENRKIVVGYIYLSIYQKNPYYDSNDMVLFEFDTTGTRMSIMFLESTSIRKAFIQFLEEYNGVSGVFNREMGGGELFWFKGQTFSIEIEDAFLLPDELEQILKGNL